MTENGINLTNIAKNLNTLLMHKIITFIIIVIAAALLSFTSNVGQKTDNNFQEKIKIAKEYCKKNGLSTELVILVDMSIHSGKNRLFVYNLKNKSIVLSGLCSHGCCEKEWGSDQTKVNPKFSNIENSHCSSLGKYKIGKRGYSNWGIHVNYKLHGLEDTNKNAYKRFIVLHSWERISDKEVYPYGTPEGWGCPAVSNSVMKDLDKLLKKQNKPVLLWMFL